MIVPLCKAKHVLYSRHSHEIYFFVYPCAQHFIHKHARTYTMKVYHEV